MSAAALGASRFIFAMRPDRNALRALVAAAAGAAAAKALRFASVAAKDWVRESLAGLKPVAAGRFIVHGAHDRAGVPANRIGIEIEAALAFGTGHHGTTRGCLLALDRLCKASSRRRRRAAHSRSRHRHRRARHRRRPRAAPARACDRHRRRRGARGARQCAAQPRRRPGRVVHADGVGGAGDPRARAPFDLVFANILLGPLQRLAAPLRRLVAPGRPVVLSGLCRRRPMPCSPPIARLALERRLDLDGWTTLVFVRRARSRPGVARRRRRSIDCARMFEAHFQSFEDRSDRGDERAAGCGAARGTRRGAGSTASSCRAPTATRTNTCRRAPSGSPGSPASPARPASPSCSPTARSLFVDGRYQVQAREEVDGAAFAIEHLVEHPPPAWIEANLPAGAKLGYSPWLHTVDGAERLAKACAAAGAQSGRRSTTIRSTPSGPTGRRRRSARWCCTICAMPAKTPRAKLARMRAEMQKLAADALMVSDPHAVSLAVQHPRQRRAAHAGGARLRHGAERRAGRRSSSIRASSATTSAHRLEETRRGAPNAAIRARSRRARHKRGARCGSIRPPARRRSRGSSPTTAARSCAAAIRSRR